MGAADSLYAGGLGWEEVIGWLWSVFWCWLRDYLLACWAASLLACQHACLLACMIACCNPHKLAPVLAKSPWLQILLLQLPN